MYDHSFYGACDIPVCPQHVHTVRSLIIDALLKIKLIYLFVHFLSTTNFVIKSKKQYQKNSKSFHEHFRLHFIINK
jgi:hypothetical protein